MICTFFGHRDTEQIFFHLLENAIEKVIQNYSVNHFYIGNNGNFDKMALQAVTKLQVKYPYITYEIVLAYMADEGQHPTLFPEGIENTPKRFAICFRNKWMVKHSDYIISYITQSYGGAYQYTKYAKNQGKFIINLSDHNLN